MTIIIYNSHPQAALVPSTTSTDSDFRTGHTFLNLQRTCVCPVCGNFATAGSVHLPVLPSLSNAGAHLHTPWCLSHRAEVKATPPTPPLPMLRIHVLSRSWATQPVCAYTGGSKTETHEEVEGGAGLAPCDVHAAAAVVQHPLAQVSTLFHLLLKQQVSKLQETQGACEASPGIFASSVAVCCNMQMSVWTSQEPEGLM